MDKTSICIFLVGKLLMSPSLLYIKLKICGEDNITRDICTNCRTVGVYKVVWWPNGHGKLSYHGFQP